MGEYDLRNYSSGDFRREFRIDPSQSTRRIRERFTGMDLNQAGGMALKNDTKDALPLLRVKGLGELAGEKAREIEVQSAIAMQMLGLNEEAVIKMRIEMEVNKAEKVVSDDEIKAGEVMEMMEKLERENPERFKEVVRIVNEEVEKERRFANLIKRN